MATATSFLTTISGKKEERSATLDLSLLGFNDNEILCSLSGEVSNQTTGLYGGINAGITASGVENILLGTSAGQALVGSGNICIGKTAGINALTTSSVIIGEDAGEAVTGTFNVIIGYGAMQFEGTTGAGNRAVCVGHRANWQGFHQSNSICIGSQAGEGIGTTGGQSNTFIGRTAGTRTSGSRNVFLGDAVARDCIGNKNVCLGYRAGDELFGDDNICIGDEAGRLAKDINDTYKYFNCIFMGSITNPALSFPTLTQNVFQQALIGTGATPSLPTAQYEMTFGSNLIERIRFGSDRIRIPIDQTAERTYNFPDVDGQVLLNTRIKYAYNSEVLSADKTLVITDFPYQYFDPNGSNRIIDLPAPTTIDEGYFKIFHVGTNRFLFIYEDGVDTGVRVKKQSSIEVHCDGTEWTIEL